MRPSLIDGSKSQSSDVTVDDDAAELKRDARSNREEEKSEAAVQRIRVIADVDKIPLEDESSESPRNLVAPSILNVDKMSDSSVRQPIAVLVKTEDSDADTPETEASNRLENIDLSSKIDDSENKTIVDNPPSDEGSVFGGLVSYFSSQHEDDIDN